MVVVTYIDEWGVRVYGSCDLCRCMRSESIWQL